jgi:DNA-binding transcriptional ArsR family regulator
MAVEVVARVWAAEGLSATEKLVLLRIADYAGPDGGNAYPSVTTIAAQTSLTDRAVRGVLRRLEDRGVLVTSHREGRSSYYRVVLDALQPRKDVPPASDSVRNETTETPEPERVNPGTPFLQSVKNHQDPSSSEHEVDRLTAALLAACRIQRSKIPRVEYARHREQASKLLDIDPVPTDDDVAARGREAWDRWSYPPNPGAIVRNWGDLEPVTKREKRTGPAACPECGGRRQVPDPDPSSRGAIECPTCHGTGRAA